MTFAGEEEKHRFLVKDGKATAVFPNADKYEGEYKGGKRNGKGTYTFARGGQYSGSYVDGKVGAEAARARGAEGGRGR